MDATRSQELRPEEHQAEKLLNDVVQEAQRRLPGVEIRSPIQAWAYLEDFSAGIRAYHHLSDPSPIDDRWLGVCLYQEMQDVEALAVLTRALARGEEAARINLAHLLRFLERSDEALDALRQVQQEKLSPYDLVFFLRVSSMHEENNGSLREALRLAEEAWRHVQTLPEFSLLAPSVLAQLAVLHGRIGRAQRALWFLERGLQNTEGHEEHKVRLRRAAVLNTLGRHLEAEAELEAVWRIGLTPNFDPELSSLFGEIHWSRGHVEPAIGRFDHAVERAMELQVVYEEFIARLALTALQSVQGDLAAAARHLARAQTLIVDKSDRLAYRFREIGVRLLQGDYTRAHALKEYQALDAEFERMGLLQEQGYVKLHMASLHHDADAKRARAILDDLQGLCVTLQNHAFLAKEWLLLPDLRRFAQRTHPELLGEQSDILEVVSLGQEGLYYAGERVPIPLRRLVEVIAYFLEHKAVSLQQLLTDVFPDEKPRSAKSYFHQCRHQLKEHLPGVEIEYDREARLYRLRSNIDIVWDVAEVRAGRRSGDFGPFLPSSRTDWTLLLDHGLDRYRGELGDATSEAA